MSRLSNAGRRGVDVLTVMVLALAVYLMVQPGSQLRLRWSQYRLNQETSRAAEVLWADLANTASLLNRESASSPQIIEISDYECPFCRKVNPVIDSAIAAGIRIAYLNYPIDIHPQARGAATAALCADEAGRFAQMHAQLMTTSAWQQDADWSREAEMAGVADLDAFQVCLTSEAMRQRLDGQIALAESLHVNGTPTFIAQNAFHRGTLSLEQLVALTR